MRRTKPLKITSRVSSVTNGFVQAILPADTPDPAQQLVVLSMLGIDPVSPTCAYCGDPSRHWDHLNPLVAKKQPTGFLNEAKNRVPACDSCNTSKSGQNWRKWIAGSARNSPASRQVADIPVRIARLEQLERELTVEPTNMAELAGPELWQAYWQKHAEIERLMFEAQRMADMIRTRISEAVSGPAEPGRVAEFG